MDTSLLHVDIGAAARTRDGRQVGKVTRAVVDPRTRRLIDLVVHWHKGLLDVRDTVVPFSAVQSAGKEVQLNLSPEDLDKLPDFVAVDYVPVPPEWFAPAPYPPGGLLWPAGFAATVFSESEHENVPEGTVALAEGTPVACPDGRVGAIDEVITDPSHARVLGFVIRRGGLLSHDVFIPLDWVAEVARDQVTLNRTKAEVAHLEAREAR